MNKQIKKIAALIFVLSVISSCSSEKNDANPTEESQLKEETTTEELRSEPESEPEEEEESLTSDFIPPTGKGNKEGTEGPWARRLLGATSKDGINWTKTNKVISDQADVADLVIDDDGRLYLYYYAWKIGNKENLAAMAISDDNGETWFFKNMNFSGFPNRGDVADPNVLYENGIFHIYGSTREMGKTMADGKTFIVHGVGTDGINFTYESVAFKPETGNAGVASVYKNGDTWNLISLASLGFNKDVVAGSTWYATSGDGESFTLKDTLLFKDGNTTYFHGNVVPFDDGYRLYVFSEGAKGIKSFFSKDGENWSIEAGYRLSLDESLGLEYKFLSDPDVTQLEDGTYFMVYSSLIPS